MKISCVCTCLILLRLMGGLEASPTSINSTSYIEELDSKEKMETLSVSTGKAETLTSSSGFNETRSTRTGSEPKLSMSEGIHEALPTRPGPNKICMNVGEAFKSYNGTVNVTIMGRPCQNWTLNFPHAHEYHGDANFPADESELAAANFCRDPSNSGYLWCYTLSGKWGHCDVPPCNETSPSSVSPNTLSSTSTASSTMSITSSTTSTATSNASLTSKILTGYIDVSSMILPSQTPVVGVTPSTTSSSVSTFSSSLPQTALSSTSTTPSTTSSNCASGSGVCVTHTDGLGSNAPASRPSMSLLVAVLLPLHVALIGG